jgi:hypothetical protein
MNYTGHGIPNGRKDIVDDEVADLDYGDCTPTNNNQYEFGF